MTICVALPLTASERNLSSNASVPRGQLSVAANQVSIQTEQMRNQTESLESDLQTSVKPTVDESAHLEQKCLYLKMNTGSLNAAEIQNVIAPADGLKSL